MKNHTVGNNTVAKIVALARFLEETHHISLARAISVSEGKIDRILRGEHKPSRIIVSRIASYFCFSPTILYDDESQLPDFDNLRLDEDLISIQRHDEQNEMERLKHKHFFGRNWRVLGYRTRIRLMISILLITIPLVLYIAYCGSRIVSEKVDTLRKYREGSVETEVYDIYSPTQVLYHDQLATTSKENNPDAYYVDVMVGTSLEKIKNISSASSSYETRLQLYFKFDKDDFRNMFRHYAQNVLADQIIDDYYTDNEEDVRAKEIDYSAWLQEHQEYFDQWVDANDRRYYPGETPSNVLTDKETMFDIGNGEFVADSYGTLKELEEVQYRDEHGNLRTMCYQKVKFNARFEKAFDSVRYPLESVQFKMYILPIMDANYCRYLPDRSETSSGERISGFSPYFSVTNGYRPIRESSGIKNFSLRLNYYKDMNNDPAITFEHSMRTQLEIIVRANRSGLSLFLQAFINLFSVVIWIIIAFYSQSYTGEDSIGMLGTGLFGAISSMLVGISMVSDAGIFSIITMINIFTLAVIMIMTYQSIAAKRAAVRKDKILIAYNGIKLRILFYVLTLCTITMFGILPAISYLWSF